MKCTGKNCPMQVGYDVEKCVATDCRYRTEPKTNADCIRSMSNEKLAEWVFMLVKDCRNCPAKSRACYVDGGTMNCYDRILEWLKKEVDDAGV